jgi:putative tryptophan/tyrosine transport system substrate-binding protein
MKRREFIAGLGSTAAWPVGARAQRAAMPVIGFLLNTTVDDLRFTITNFSKGLMETGYFVDQNVTIDYRPAEHQNERLPQLARDLVTRRVNLIVAAGSTPVASAAKAATQDIPIVFLIGGNPVNPGFVESFAHPGRNMTGVTTMSSELTNKRVELLHELVPRTTLMMLFVNETAIPTARGDELFARRAASALGIELRTFNVQRPEDIEPAFMMAKEFGAGSVVLGTDNLFQSQVALIVASAARNGVPTMYQQSTAIRRGGLISFVAEQGDLARYCGVYAGRILKGEKPADLPVQRPTKFEMVINVKTAKALGLTIPETLLATADEVIQ